MRLIDADALKKDLKQYFTDGVLDGVSARLVFNQILHDIDNAPTIKDSSLEIAQKSIELGRKVGQLEGKLERPQGDLISRSELKKCAIPCEIHNGALTDLCVPLYQVDNAPTVEGPKYILKVKSLTAEDKKRFQEEWNKSAGGLLAVPDNYEIVPIERPLGEWLKDKVAFHFVCNQCGCALRQLKSEVFEGDYDYNFCPNCGAKMKGGAE